MAEHDCTFVSPYGMGTLFCQADDDCGEYNPDAVSESHDCGCCSTWVDAQGDPIATY
jgi:hypothetical protein